MNPNKALWEKGDFTRIAASMRQSGEALVKGLGITKGLKVLDLGCGDGTTALPEAKLGADVLGVDIAKNLVEAGNKRAKEEGLTNCKFQEGDASNLHELKDQTFDLVVSIFGAMFAPKPFDVAKEMVRVTRPGGRIVMGNWIPNDPTLVAQILKISSSYSPPPPEGFISPMTWGIENNVIERFAGAGVPKEKISFVRDTYTFNFPGTPSDFVDAFRKYYGPTMNAFDAAEKNGRAGDLQKELEGSVHQPKQRPKQGCHLHSGDLLTRYRYALIGARTCSCPLWVISGHFAMRGHKPSGENCDAIRSTNDADVNDFWIPACIHRAIQKQAILRMLKLLTVSELKQRLLDEVRLDGHVTSWSSGASFGSLSSISSIWSSRAAVGTILPSSSSSMGNGGSNAS